MGASTGASESLDTTASTGTTDESGNDDKVKDVVKDIDNEAEELDKEKEEKAAKEKEEKEKEDKDIKNPVDIDGSGTHDEKVEEDKDIKKQSLEPTASTGTTDESGNDDKVKDVVKDINNEAEELDKAKEEKAAKEKEEKEKEEKEKAAKEKAAK